MRVALPVCPRFASWGAAVLAAVAILHPVAAAAQLDRVPISVVPRPDISSTVDVRLLTKDGVLSGSPGPGVNQTTFPVSALSPSGRFVAYEQSCTGQTAAPLITLAPEGQTVQAQAANCQVIRYDGSAEFGPGRGGVINMVTRRTSAGAASQAQRSAATGNPLRWDLTWKVGAGGMNFDVGDRACEQFKSDLPTFNPQCSTNSWAPTSHAALSLGWHHSPHLGARLQGGYFNSKRSTFENVATSGTQQVFNRGEVEVKGWYASLGPEITVSRFWGNASFMIFHGFSRGELGDEQRVSGVRLGGQTLRIENDYSRKAAVMLSLNYMLLESHGLGVGVDLLHGVNVDAVPQKNPARVETDFTTNTLTFNLTYTHKRW